MTAQKQPSGANGAASERPAPPHPMKCEEIQDVLFDYMSRELGDARSELVRAHLKKCPACQEAAAQIQSTLDLLKQASDDQSGVATSLSAEHRERLSRAVLHPVLDWMYRHHIIVSIVAAGIALGLLMLALRQIHIWRQDRPTPGPPVMIGPPPEGAVLPGDATQTATEQDDEL